ncbi:MAG TPA: SAM-dependent chlorinase/fluorinase [Leptolyngbyaceae cyanobacterium M33_DOE_097]|uniref:SAM-dependent chlorinase/fluorinase n=1 Tax=Oscillatoriales cyanobacterium SpSt-418 TaxID=2282169 RepID=A0A7C3KBS7_9CYAN|nr:SAM-dependent chlorinase/fluorinase [Leptolyngbyaceae cyanobacterium M33_DOE_097]
MVNSPLLRSSGLVTLTSDFGVQDTYVGVMKGAISQVNLRLTLIDLTHHIPPQNILAARFALMTAVPYFPAGTVHLAVVDPGVGSQRRAIAIAAGTADQEPWAFLVGPDNGILSGVLQIYPALAAVELDNPAFWRCSEPSATFHGRDIFAPVAAHLASGIPLQDLGTAIAPDCLVRANLPEPRWDGNLVVGTVQAIDHFGNLVTNILGRSVAGKGWRCQVGDRRIASGYTYSDVALGELVAIVGSHGWVEIAVNGGNAQEQLHLDWGGTVELFVEG